MVKQSEIQSRGGICAKYPVACIIRDMLSEAGLLKPFKPIKVLDLTYGQGIFWIALPQAMVIGFDIRKLKWVRTPYKFYQKSCEKWKTTVIDESFDLVVADPPFMPYRRGTEKRRHFEADNIALIFNEARKAAEYYRCPLLVHFMWKALPYGFTVVTERWLKPMWFKSSKMHYVSWFGILRIGD